jgi:hypothetical protein
MPVIFRQSLKITAELSTLKDQHENDPTGSNSCAEECECWKAPEE